MSKIYKRNCDVCGKYYEHKNAQYACSIECRSKLPGIRNNSGQFKKGEGLMGKWARKFDKCVECGTTEIKHFALGHCKKCYMHHPRYISSLKKYRHSDKWKETKRVFDLKSRLETLSHYSGAKDPVCACCGEKDYRFLAIDHINGGGRKHLIEIKYARLSVWLKRNKYPTGYQILCHNCNMGKAIYKVCPHKLS